MLRNPPNSASVKLPYTNSKWTATHTVDWWIWSGREDEHFRIDRWLLSFLSHITISLLLCRDYIVCSLHPLSLQSFSMSVLMLLHSSKQRNHQVWMSGKHPSSHFCFSPKPGLLPHMTCWIPSSQCGLSPWDKVVSGLMCVGVISSSIHQVFSILIWS